MSRLFVFADEAGDFSFTHAPNVSRYFILTTITLQSCDIANDLMQLRRRLAWEGYELGDSFHATTDAQAVRDEVFGLLASRDFRIQATIMEKSKAQPQVRVSRPRFYKYGWFYHFKHGARPIILQAPELMVVAASLGTKKERKSFTSVVDDVVQQTAKGTKFVTNFCPAAADPCLQVADYCAWAMQRKWERNDRRSYDLIRHKITYEYDLWAHGKKHFY